MSDLPPLLHRWKHKYSILSTVAFPHKKILFAGTQDSKILCFDLTTYSLINTISLQSGIPAQETDNTQDSVLCLSRSSDEKYLFAGGSDSLVRIWKIEVLEKSLGSNATFVYRNSESAIEDDETKISEFDASKENDYCHNEKLKSIIINADEVATIYSTLDIGDIFSLVYLDKTQTVIIGTQRAAILYANDIFNTSRYSNRYELLPHNRFDKFFDSRGPAGNLSPRQPRNSFSSLNSVEGNPSLQDNCESLSQQRNNNSSSPVSAFQHSIIEFPSKNIINYAHNGFIYSLCKYENNLEDSEEELIVSGAGDGVTKIWKLNPETFDLEPVFQLPLASNIDFASLQEVDNLDEEYEDDIILSQTVQFPFLYCGLNEGNVKIWDLTTKQLISTIKCGESLNDVTSICCWEDCVFAATKDIIVTFKGSKLISWVGHKGTILSMSFLKPKCTQCKHIRLISGGSDGTLALWNIDTILHDLMPACHTEKFKKLSDAQNSSRGDIKKNNTKYHTLFTNDHLLESLKSLIEFQTVSGKIHDTSSILDSHSCATYLLRLFSNFGAATTKLVPVATGNKAPIVYAKFFANYKHEDAVLENQESDLNEVRNILWYGHYDVIEPGNNWKTDPFQLVAENGYLKGRGVSDNKGPLLAAIYAVADLYDKKMLKNNICFLIEGQEENGSNGFIDSLQEANINMNEKIDSILLSNSYWLDETTPCMNYGLRGVVNMRITVTSDEPDRHSGVDGGIYQEPTTDLFQIVSKLIEGPKKVRIPNFYAPLKDISPNEVQKFKDIVERSNIATNVDELISKWCKPSLSITTMQGGTNATVISKTADATVSIRIVPEQDIKEIKQDTIDYLKSSFKLLESPNHLKIEILNEAEPWLGNTESKAYKLLKNELEEVWGIEPFLVREGGSIATVRLLEQYFHAPAIQIPAGQSTDNAHLANEQLRILNLFNLRKVVHNTINLL